MNTTTMIQNKNVFEHIYSNKNDKLQINYKDKTKKLIGFDENDSQCFQGTIENNILKIDWFTFKKPSKEFNEFKNNLNELQKKYPLLFNSVQIDEIPNVHKMKINPLFQKGSQYGQDTVKETFDNLYKKIDTLSSDFKELLTNFTNNGLTITKFFKDFETGSFTNESEIIKKITNNQITTLIDFETKIKDVAMLIIVEKFLDKVVNIPNIQLFETILSNKDEDKILLKDTTNQYQHVSIKLKEPKINDDIFFFDINYLKLINDDGGHDYGDVYLKTFTKIILQTFSEIQLFRKSGDEFIGIIQYDSKTTNESKLKKRHKIQNFLGSVEFSDVIQEQFYQNMVKHFQNEIIHIQQNQKLDETTKKIRINEINLEISRLLDKPYFAKQKIKFLESKILETGLEHNQTKDLQQSKEKLSFTSKQIKLTKELETTKQINVILGAGIGFTNYLGKQEQTTTYIKNAEREMYLHKKILHLKNGLYDRTKNEIKYKLNNPEIIKYLESLDFLKLDINEREQIVDFVFDLSKQEKLIMNIDNIKFKTVNNEVTKTLKIILELFHKTNLENFELSN